MKKILPFHRLYCILTMFLLPVCLLAQEDQMLISHIKVVDAFTEEPLDKAQVSVLEQDSSTVLVESLWPRFMTAGEKRIYLGFQGNIPPREHIVLRIQCQGYPTEYYAWDIPLDKKGKHPKVARYPKGIYIWPETDQSLGEATVNASRILMVMKGDTIEYNAAAFRMHEGSMLDNLVRALPGVNLDDDGRITVNGEFVKSLLVNGRDFFNGDPKIALRNLPAYTVNKVQVYRRNDRRKYLNDQEPVSEEEKRKDPLVMDVRLKREYAQGWISNYEVGGGSTLKSPLDAKWLGRLFALRYTNHSSLGIFAAANNTNDGSTPGSKGEWSKMDASDGEKKTYFAGVQFSLEPKDTKIEFNTSLTAKREESVFWRQAIGETYYDKTRTFSNSVSESNNKSTDLQWQARLTQFLNKDFYTISTTAYYKHNKERNTSSDTNLQAQSGSDLDTLYSRNVWGRRRETAWGTDLGASYYPRFSWGDLGIHSQFTYNKRDQTHSQRDRLLYKLQDGNDLIEQRHFTVPQFDYKYQFHGSYGKNIRKDKFRFYTAAILEYEQQFNSGHQDLTRSDADWLAPSAAADSWVIDDLNTYHTTRMERWVRFIPRFSFSCNESFGFSIDGELSTVFRRISDLRANKEQESTPKDFLFDPLASLFWKKNAHYVEVLGLLRNQLPALTYMLDVTESSDPLLHYEGNPELQTTREYRIKATYRYEEKENYMRRIELQGGYSEWENSIGNARFYNRTSGVTTIRPMNISGTWRAWAWGSYSRMMGKMKRWNFSNTFKFNFNHSLDYNSDQSDETPVKSAVDNLNLVDNLRVDYRINETRVGAKVDFSWTQQKSLQHRFDRYAFTQVNYGVSLSTPTVWDIHLSTDLMAYCRRGYSDASMNTTDWVWNAELSRPLGKKKQWVIKATGFDLLQQISSIRRTVNAQGWTETRYNTKPSYAMLTIFYRLDVKPKKTFQKK